MTETYFKEDDLVTCSMYGQGVVENIKYFDEKYLIGVKFKGGIMFHYTFDGRFEKSARRTLHQGHIDIPEPVLVSKVEYTKNEVVYYRELTYWYIGFYQSDMRVRSQAGDFCTAKEIRKFDNPPNFKQ